MQFHAYTPGDRLLTEGTVWEVTRVARTRWGSETYRIQSIDGEASRWLSPRRSDRPATMVDRPAIIAMVHRFYAQVGEDPALGPVFAPRLGGDWSHHLERMVSFWSAVLLREPGYDGRPGRVHKGIAELAPRHFGRWLEMFGATLREVFAPAVAAELEGRARQMARGLSTASLGRPWDDDATPASQAG